MLKPMIGHLSHWQDNNAKQNLYVSNKGKEAQKAEVENILKQVAMRFERSPNPNTIRLWASDIIDAGYNDQVVQQAVKSVPHKFEKHPTLAQIFELLRPYLPQMQSLESDLDKYTRLAIPHLKAKLINMVGEDGFEKLKNYYRAHVLKTDVNLEVAVLGDWCRCFLGKPQDIVKQGIESNSRAEQNDTEYFIKPLRQYCVKNNLI